MATQYYPRHEFSCLFVSNDYFMKPIFGPTELPETPKQPETNPVIPEKPPMPQEPQTIPVHEPGPAMPVEVPQIV